MTKFAIAVLVGIVALVCFWLYSNTVYQSTKFSMDIMMRSSLPRIFSPNKLYFFEVHDDEVHEVGESKEKVRHFTGILTKKDSGGKYQLVWSGRFSTSDLPLNASVSESGEVVIKGDHGQNVVASYDQLGNLVPNP